MYIAKSAATAKNLSFQLKVGGFVAVSESDSLIAVRKPDYEVGSSVKVVDTSSNGKKKLWSVEAMDDLEADDLINDEELLDEADRAKPSAEELRVCATTKQRKACANCSCGLAQELEAEEKEKIRENSQNAKSSCGSVSPTATTKLLALIFKPLFLSYSATWAMRSAVPPVPTEACQHSNRGKRRSLMLATICEEERMMLYYCSILLLIVTQQRFSKLCFTVLFPIH